MSEIYRNTAIHKQATEIIKELYGKDASFREGQYEAIEATMTQKRTLVVQRTGWGKSLVYSDGMLVKRPILISDDFVLVGFKEADWEAKLK